MRSNRKRHRPEEVVAPRVNLGKYFARMCPKELS